MNNQSITVSVICTAYNHEKYIRKCLDGIVGQKTNFKFEAIIHDDASTDTTADIIREYEARFSKIIKPIYQKENQYSKGIDIYTLLLPYITGKYVALCEGDDYWSSPKKLQLQVDMLENYPDSSFATHIVRGVDESGAITNVLYPSFSMETSAIPKVEFLSIVSKQYAFQTSSFVFKSESYLEFLRNPPEFVRICPIRDIPMMLYFGYVGDVCFINQEMSCYRMSSDGSWTQRHNSLTEFRVNHYRAMSSMVEQYRAFTQNQFPEFYDNLYRRWYNQLWFHRDFKEVLKKQYNQFFKMEPFKDRVYALLSAFFPKVFK